MAWYSWDKKQAPKAETKSAVLGLNDTLSNFLLFGSSGGGTPASALRLYEQSTAVSIPVNYIADGFAGLTPVVRKGDKIITDHPVLDLINSPSPYYTREHLFEMMGKNYLITGESFLAAIGGIGRPPIELQPISPSAATLPEGAQGLPTSILITGNTLAGTYKPQRKKNQVRYIMNNLTEIMQTRSFSTKGNSLLRGQSPLLQASKEVRQHILGNDHNVSILEKGGRLSLVFHFDQNMDDDDFQEAKKRIRDQYGGASQAGEIGVTTGEKMEIKEFGVNNKDMDFAVLQGMTKQAVALQYKVPLPLITIDALTLNNYQEAKMALYDDGILPLADTLFGGLTQFLMPRYNEDPSKTVITYNIDNITALTTRRNEQLKLRKEINVETDNEFRETMGKEPIEGGNVIYKPASLVPAGNDLFNDAGEPIKPTAARDEE